MTLWMEVFATIDIIFVVKNSFQAPISPPKVPSPEEAEAVGPTTIGQYPK
jgi:hypothetical protein